MNDDWKWTLGCIVLMFVLAITGWIVHFVVFAIYGTPFLMLIGAVLEMSRPPTPHVHGPLVKKLGYCPTCHERF